MTSSEADACTRTYFLILHPCDRTFITEHGGNLPSLADEDIESYAPHELSDLITTRFGFAHQILLVRKACLARIDNESFMHQLYVFEVFKCNQAGTEAADIIDMQQFPVASSGHAWTRAAPGTSLGSIESAEVAQYLHHFIASDGQLLHDEDELLKPICKPGWLTATLPWVRQHLPAALVDVRQLKCGASGYVAELTTVTDEVFYLRAGAIALYGVCEAALSVSLQAMQGACTGIVAADTGRDLLLLRDLGDALGTEHHGVTYTDPFCARGDEKGISSFVLFWAGVQRDSVIKVSTLACNLSVVNDMRVRQLVSYMTSDHDWLAAQADGMLESDETIIDAQSHAGKYIDYVRTVLDEVAGHHVPLALVHGDMSPSCIIHKSGHEGHEGRFYVTAFASAVASFPFLDIVRLRQADGVQINDQCIEAYLSQWVDFESMDRLWELWHLIVKLDEILGFVHIYLKFKRARRNDRVILFEDMKLAVVDDYMS